MTVYPKIPQIEIENVYDLGIWQKELSYCKLFKNYFSLNCVKNRDTLNAYLIPKLGKSTKKEFIDSLIKSFSEIEKIIKITNNNVELTEKFPIYVKAIKKSIKLWKKQRHDESIYELGMPQSQKSDKTEEVKGDVKT